MKKYIIATVIIILTGLAVMSALQPVYKINDMVQPEEYIRFHVLANSDSDDDQRLKLKVRDAIIEEFSPLLATADTLEQSRILVKENLDAIAAAGKQIVESEGESYSVRAEFGLFNFPLKSYNDLTLPAGSYEAVRVVIGEGGGANWWCVLFPPLCFVDVTDFAAEYETKEKKQGEIQVKTVEKQVEEKQVKPVVKLKIVEVFKGFFH